MIALDAVSTGTHAGFSHTCAGSDRLLLVMTSGSGTLTGVTYNGVAMAAIGSPGATAWGATSSVWWLAAPASGSHAIALAGTSLNLDVEAISYTGAAQAVPEVITTTASAASASTWTSTITTLTDGAWLVVAAWSYFFGNPPSAGTGLTSRQIGANYKDGWFDSNGPVSPPGSVSGETTQTGGGGWPITHVALSIAPVPPPTITGTGTITFAKPTLAGTGTAIPPPITGTGAVTFAKPALAGAGGGVAPVLPPVDPAPPPPPGWVFTIGGVVVRAQAGSVRIRLTANGRDTLSCDVVSLDGTYRPQLDAYLTVTHGDEEA